MSLLPLDDWATNNTQCSAFKPKAPHGQARPHVLCWVLQHKIVHKPQASPGPTNHSCFVHWVTLLVRHHPVLVTETLQEPSVLFVPSTPGLMPWQPCHCSLITFREGHLTDRQLWKFFIKKNAFRRKDRLQFWHALLMTWNSVLVSFAWGHLTAYWLMWYITVIY